MSLLNFRSYEREGCKVGCWAGVTELEISCFSSFHLCPEFRSRDCEEEQEEEEGWEVCVAGVAW